MPGLIQPTTLFFHFIQNAFGFGSKIGNINRRIVVISNKGGGGGKVYQHGFARAEFGDGLIDLTPPPLSRGERGACVDVACFVHAVAQALDGFSVPTQLGGHAGHACAAEAVKDNVPWVGIVQNVAHNGFVRHFSMVRMRVVDRVIFALRNVRGEGFSVIVSRDWRVESSPIVLFTILYSLLSFLFLPLLNDLSQKRIGAGGVIRR
ncbi:MAG: hypothetical protein ABIL11_04660, partial [Chloroflexota bacterium]